MMEGVQKSDLLITPKVPQGLAAAIESLTREVIRQRPENIYVFAADHFNKLLRLREEHGITPEVKNKTHIKSLRDMDESIKQRRLHLESKKAKNYVRSTNWTLHEAANVLEKYQRIFGESGQKIDIAEIRKLANKPTITPPKIRSYSHTKKRYEAHRVENKHRIDKYPIASTSKARESPHCSSSGSSGFGKGDSKNTPRIIPQILPVKDIKTELKKNQIYSRQKKKTEEKKMQVACEYNEYKREKIVEKTFKRSIESMGRSLENWNEEKKILRTDVVRKSSEATKVKGESSRMKKSSRPSKMDEVRNYTVKNIADMSRLNDLQSPDYIEKVQEVIDETTMVIKEKVEALKAGLINAAKAKQSKSDNSSSNDEFFENSSRSEKGTHKNLFKSSSYQNLSKKNESFQILQDDLESEKSESLGKNNTSLEQPKSNISDFNDSNECNISLPVVRTPSSKSISRSLSDRSHSDSLILPPISPESNKSTKATEEIVLPVLSSSNTNSISTDSINTNEKIVEKIKVNNEEKFQDSLNVSPDLSNAIQVPDSLEISEIGNKSNNSGHISSLETLKDKLLEIEEAQKRITDVLDDKITTKDKNLENEGMVTSKIHDKLLEIEESEKRIEKILDFQPSSIIEHEIINIDIKSKLQELEDTERRIENILINETDNEYLKNFDALETNIEQENNNLTHENITNINESNTQKDLECKTDNTLCLSEKNNDLQKNSTKSSMLIEAMSPDCYILTEGSPHDIPDSVTTVIIPDRNATPDSDSLQLELEDGEIFSTLISSKKKNDSGAENYLNESEKKKKYSIDDAFGEVVDTTNLETGTENIKFISDMEMKYDIIPKNDLDLIQEECDKERDEDAGHIDSEDEKVLKVVTTSLEEILEKDKVEYILKKEIQSEINNSFKDEDENVCLSQSTKITEHESNDETRETYSISDGIVENIEAIENFLDIEGNTEKSAESTTGLKESSITTDRSSLPFDPVAFGPSVPELNLDSLTDLTISSFNITDEEKKEENKNDVKILNSSEASASLDVIKENKKISEEDLREKFTTEVDVKEIENDHAKIIETFQENSVLDLKENSNKFVQKLCTTNTEELKDEDLRENVIFDKLDARENVEISEKSSTIERKNIKNDFDDQIKTQVAAVTLDTKMSKSDNIENTAPDKISIISNENVQEKEISLARSESAKDLLPCEALEAESSSSRELENDPLLSIEQNYLRDFDTDQNSQFVDSSIVSIDCTDPIDSDNLSKEMSIETSNITRNTQSQNTEAVEEKAVDVTAVTEEIKKNSINEEKKHCHIYVPEMVMSKDASSSTASSTFMSAATKIQAGIRGFLTRRRLQSCQPRSSTLDSIPSIELSAVGDNSAPSTKIISSPSSSSSSCLQPIAKNTSSISDLKNRKKLCREDAVQRKTLSLENAFANNQVQHTGEFHDCIPLPVFDTEGFSFKITKEQVDQDKKDNFNSSGSQNSRKESAGKVSCQSNKFDDKVMLVSHVENLDSKKKSSVGQLVEEFLPTSTMNLSDFSKLEQSADVPLPGDNEILQKRYLNFITSVEDVTRDSLNSSVLPNSPQGVIIQEITNLDENKSKGLKSISDKENNNIQSEDDIKQKKLSNESLSKKLGPQIEQENSNGSTSNVFERNKGLDSNIKEERSIDNSVNKQTLSEVETLEIESLEGSLIAEQKSENNTNSSLGQKTGNEISEKKEMSSLVDLSFSDEIASMNIDEFLGLDGEQDKNQKNTNKMIPNSSMLEQLRRTSVSQESRSGDVRPGSPLTMMQIPPMSVEESSDNSKDGHKDESCSGEDLRKIST